MPVIYDMRIRSSKPSSLCLHTILKCVKYVSNIMDFSFEMKLIVPYQKPYFNKFCMYSVNWVLVCWMYVSELGMFYTPWCL